MGSFGARDAIFPLTLRLEFIEPSTTIVHEPPLVKGIIAGLVFIVEFIK